MAEFQFYRPQANALEQLWSQYAAAKKDSLGTALSAMAPGLAEGLTNIGKNLETERQRKFEIENREDIQAFQKGEREAGQDFQTIERISSQYFQQGERALDRQTQRDLAKDEADARKTASDAKAAAARSEVTATLVAYGETPEQAAKNAFLYSDSTAAANAKKAELERLDKEAKAQAKVLEDTDRARRSNVGAAAIRPYNGDPYVDQNQWRQIDAGLQSTDIKEVTAAQDAAVKLAAEAASRQTASARYQAFQKSINPSELKKQGRTSAVLPEKEIEFTKLTSELDVLNNTLNDPRWWAAASPQARQAKLDAYYDKLALATAMSSPNAQFDQVRDARLRDKGYSELATYVREKPMVTYSDGAVGFGPGKESQTATINAQLNRYTNDLIRNDQSVRMMMEGVGIAPQKIDELTSATADPMALYNALSVQGKATPEQVKAIKDRVKALKKEAMQELGIQVQDAPIPQGMKLYQANIDRTPEESRQMSSDLLEEREKFMKEYGRPWTKEEVALAAASRGYYNLDYPTYTREFATAEMTRRSKARKESQAKDKTAGAAAPATTAATPAAQPASKPPPQAAPKPAPKPAPKSAPVAAPEKAPQMSAPKYRSAAEQEALRRVMSAFGVKPTGG